jgi:hypothetical protein
MSSTIRQENITETHKQTILPTQTNPSTGLDMGYAHPCLITHTSKTSGRGPYSCLEMPHTHIPPHIATRSDIQSSPGNSTKRSRLTTIFQLLQRNQSRNYITQVCHGK